MTRPNVFARLTGGRRDTVGTTTASRMLDVSERTIRRYCEQGLLPGATNRGQRGQHWKIPVESITALSGLTVLADTHDETTDNATGQ